MQPGHSLSPDASALEHMPHLVRQLCELWGREEFENHVNGVIMDSRDGRRLGLPPDAVADLLFLVELTIAKRALIASESTGMPFRQAFRQHLEKAQKFAPSKPGEANDPWSNPFDRHDVDRTSRMDYVSKPAPAAPVKRGPTHKKKSWWRRLVG